MEEIIPIIGILAVFGIPLSAIWTSHLRKMAEIKAQQSTDSSESVTREITALRQEVAHLRDTTTKFDMSFDAAITRLEDRMEKAETNINTVQESTGTYPTVTPTSSDKEREILRAKLGR
jgi:FtsZ-interacting cell division protein ZipA